MAHCIITGGADGIGKALVERYAAAGQRITIVDRDGQQAAQLCATICQQGGQVEVIIADLADHQALAGALEQLCQMPPADLLIHSAGISAVGRFSEVAVERQRAVLDVNLRAPLLLTAGLLGQQRIARAGTLVFIASLSVFTGYPGALAYAASKEGIAAYARSLRVALRPQQINVLTVFPGPTRTAHARRYSPDNRREQHRMPPEHLAALIEHAVLQRQVILIPGMSNRLAALMGRVWPGLAEFMMRKIVYERLP